MVLIEISQEGMRVPQKREKCIYLVKGNNLRFPRKWKRVPGKWKWYLTGRRLFSKVRIYIIRAVDLFGRANFSHKRAQNSIGD